MNTRFAYVEFIFVAFGVLTWIVLLFLQVKPYSNHDSSTADGYCAYSFINKSYEEPKWVFVGSTDNIDTYMRTVPGSNLLAFKGAAIVDLNVSQAFGTYMNASYTSNWVNLLENMTSAATKISVKKKPSISIFSLFFKEPKQSIFYDVIYQYFKFPWPLSPRDFVFSRSVEYDEKEKLINVAYTSISDSRFPIKNHTVRAESPSTNWVFQNAINYCALSKYSDLVNNITKPSGNTSDMVLVVDKGNNQINGTVWKKMRNRLHDLRCKLNKDSDNCKMMVHVNHPSPYKKLYWRFVKRAEVPVDINKKSAVDAACENLIEKYKKRVSLPTQTYIEIEGVVDYKGNIPSWFLNYIQRSWPVKTIRKFSRQAQLGECKPHPKVLHW